MIKQTVAEGFCAPSGSKWIRVTHGGDRAWVPHREFHAAGKSALERLAKTGLTIIGAAAIKAMTEKVAALSDFPALDLIEQIGWNGQHFALPDGTVFSPDGAVAGDVLFERIPKRCSERGRLRAWKRDVATPIAGQSIPVFALCLAYTAPILKLTNRVGNFGFELVGGKGTGKSTAQQIMASVLGGAIQGEDGHYWQTLDTTADALEQAMETYSDLPLILEEANLYLAGGTARQRGDAFKALAFRLASGTEKARYGGAPPRTFRLVYIMSSNESLASVMGVTSETAKAAEDRLITIPMSRDRPHGIFDSLPPEFASGGALAEALVDAADLNHGNSIRRFLKELVKARAFDEATLRSDIKRWMEEFRARANGDQNDGSASRVVGAFALVYAAGMLATRYGALPKAMRIGPAVLDCYRYHLSKGSALEAFADDLTAIATRADVVDLGSRKVESLSEDEYARASGFIRRRKSGRELWIHTAKIKLVLPNWSALKHRADVVGTLNQEGRHNTVKRPSGPGGEQMRVYCFNLPDVA